ncbi:S8 family serine peptidase [Myroides fluvii]|uniref:S8 family serine peptidase n=1 Tax=Myroides fluvii TaxID=2572594 RepID=UPI001E655D55|nr:S8 family serine peptidase [Myroides fluvii]
MPKMSALWSILFVLGGVSLSAQSPAIRQQLQQKYTTEDAEHIQLQIEKEAASASEKLREYQKHNRYFKAQFTDEVNYYQAQRMERNTVIYFKTHNVISRASSGVNQLSESTNPTFNALLGQQMVVGVIDGDLVFPKHKEFSGQPQGRVKILDKWEVNTEEGTRTFVDLERRRNHATHVTGTILAEGKNREAKGMAPKAEALSYQWNNDMVKLGNLGRQGILVSNHSYGIAAVDDNKQPLLPKEYFGTYSIDAVHLDQLTYLYPYLQPVIAAGNDKLYANIVNPEKQGMDLLLGHANAKNAIVVGAISLQASGIFEETEFSSNGPTNDFRIKPDIVAIGKDVLSTAYQYRFTNGDIEKDNLYTTLSGTSMAAPSVAGILLLWQQWRLNHSHFPYKAATIKGIMINSAKPFSQEKGPNARTGWGVVHAWNGIQLLDAANNKQAVIREETLLNKESKVIRISVEEPMDQLSFTICWTDVAGTFKEENFSETNASKTLVNDLDLRVYKDGIVYFPWKLTERFVESKAVQGDNQVDNVERIDIENPALGVYEVVVSHKGQLKNQVQDYSLIVNGNTYNGVVLLAEQEEKDVEQVVAWPNPVEEILNIEIPQPFVFTALEVVIYDQSGKYITSLPIQAANRQSLNVSFLSRGMYFLTITGAFKKYQVKFIKR